MLASGAPGVGDAGPYLVVLIELPDAGNVRMVGNLLGDPLQEVVIGTEVEVEYEDHKDAATLVQWRIVGPSASPEALGLRTSSNRPPP